MTQVPAGDGQQHHGAGRRDVRVSRRRAHGGGSAGPRAATRARSAPGALGDTASADPRVRFADKDEPIAARASGTAAGRVGAAGQFGPPPNEPANNENHDPNRDKGGENGANNAADSGNSRPESRATANRGNALPQGTGRTGTRTNATRRATGHDAPAQRGRNARAERTGDTGNNGAGGGRDTNREHANLRDTGRDANRGTTNRRGTGRTAHRADTTRHTTARDAPTQCGRDAPTQRGRDAPVRRGREHQQARANDAGRNGNLGTNGYDGNATNRDRANRDAENRRALDRYGPNPRARNGPPGNIDGRGIGGVFGIGGNVGNDTIPNRNVIPDGDDHRHAYGDNGNLFPAGDQGRATGNNYGQYAGLGYYGAGGYPHNGIGVTGRTGVPQPAAPA